MFTDQSRLFAGCVILGEPNSLSLSFLFCKMGIMMTMVVTALTGVLSGSASTAAWHSAWHLETAQ